MTIRKIEFFLVHKFLFKNYKSLFQQTVFHEKMVYNTRSSSRRTRSGLVCAPPIYKKRKITKTKNILSSSFVTPSPKVPIQDSHTPKTDEISTKTRSIVTQEEGLSSKNELQEYKRELLPEFSATTTDSIVQQPKEEKELAKENRDLWNEIKDINLNDDDSTVEQDTIESKENEVQIMQNIKPEPSEIFDIDSQFKAIYDILDKKPYTGALNEKQIKREAKAKSAALTIHLNLIRAYSHSYTGAGFVKEQLINEMIDQIMKVKSQSFNYGDLAISADYSKMCNTFVRNTVERIEKLLLRKPIYEVNIDFDGASRAWKANKKYLGDGTYRYLTKREMRYKLKNENSYMSKGRTSII